MTFKTSVLLVALLVLCLAVPSVNAVSYTMETPGDNHNFGELQPNEEIIINKPPHSLGISFSGAQNTFDESLSRYASSSDGSYSFKVYTAFSTQQGIMVVESTMSYTVATTPEPTPGPVNPYISVTELYSDNLGTVYRFQCLPDADTIVYSSIVPYLIPAYQAGQYAEELRSADTVIEYRVPAGGTSVFSSVYATYPMTLGVISTTVTAPALTPEQNQTYNPIPDQSQKPLTPFTSGTWQPAITSGQIDVISKSPYIALLSNISDSVQLPVMESPQSVRDRLVPPELENITGPLYDLVDSWADFTNWIPRTIADTVVTLYTPFTTAISDCKTVLLSMTAQLAELMKPMYILTPVMYLFIPDFVWIGVCMVLVLLILHALAVFIFGYDVTYYYMGRETIVADAVPEFPALEK